MKSQRDVTRIFNQFAGRVVRMKEKQITLSNPTLWDKLLIYSSGAQLFQPYTQVKPDWTDTTLLKMLFTAKAHGLKLFLHYPRHTVTPRAPGGPYEERENRVTVYIQKGTDGKWRVYSAFPLG